MKKLIKWIAILTGLLMVMVVAAVFLMPMLVDVQSYKPQIEKKVSEITGRPFTLAGELNLSVFPWVAISLSDLSLGNPEGYQATNFIKIKSFKARVKLLPLLSNEIEVKQFILDGPEIYLERRSDGQANWMGIGKKSTKQKKPGDTDNKDKQPTDDAPGELPIKSLIVGEFAITNGHIHLNDQRTQVTKEFSAINLHLSDISLDRPIGIAFDAMVENKPVALQGTVGPIGKEPGKDTLHFNLTADALNQLRAELKGSLIAPATKPEIDLSIHVAPFSPKQLFTTLEQDFPIKTIDPDVLNKVGVTLKVKGSPTAVSLSNGLLILDDSQLKFMAVVQKLNKPDINFKIDLDQINLDRYLPPPTGNKTKLGEAADKAKGGSGQAVAAKKKEINYEPLRQLVINGELKIDKLIAHGAKIADISLKLEGHDGIFTLDPCSLNLYDGSISTVAAVNVQGKSPKTNITLQSKNIQVGPLLRDSANKDILEGAVETKVSLRLEGDEPNKIKRTLNGKGELFFRDGAVVGIDVAGMVRNIKASFAGEEQTLQKPRTDFAELQVPFTLTNGLFKTTNTKLASPLLRLSMSGNADLVKETLNFKLKPKVVGTLKGQGDAEARSGIMVPVIVDGTFKSPQFHPDLEGMISNLAPTQEDIIKALITPENDKDGKKPVEDLGSTLKDQGKSLEEQGKNLLKSFGFGN